MSSGEGCAGTVDGGYGAVDGMPTIAVMEQRGQHTFDKTLLAVPMPNLSATVNKSSVVIPENRPLTDRLCVPT